MPHYEGTNAQFKENVGPTSSLVLFVKEFDKIMSTMNEIGNLKGQSTRSCAFTPKV
jgi:hypothetical protein